jgi:glutaredoxin
MRITVYTVSDCQFSKAEKEYIQLHNLPYEEKNIEQNREWLTEMLTVSNNFAGTPVTKIEKNDGTIVVLKGFTKDEFDKELGLSEHAIAQVNAQVNLPSQPNPQPQTSPTQPVTPPPTPIVPNPPTPQTPIPSAKQTAENGSPTIPSISTAVAPPPQDPVVEEKLNNILNNLEEKAKTDQPATSSPAKPPAPTQGLPNIPNFTDEQ